jgi:hypothetical protein
MKDNGANLSETGSQNPYQLLLHQLTGIQPKRPRLRTAANVWQKTGLPEIEKEVQRRANDLGWAKSKLAPLREKVTKELYDALLVMFTGYPWMKFSRPVPIPARDQTRKHRSGNPANTGTGIHGTHGSEQPVQV